MKTIVVYDLDGEIERVVKTDDAGIAALYPDGVPASGVLVLDAQDVLPSKHYVSGGAIVEYTPEQNSAKADQHATGRKWRNSAMEWQDARTLTEIKTDKWEVIKLARAAHIDSGLATPYGDFQTAPPGRQNITDAVLLAQTLASQSQPVSIDWTLADNTVVTLGLTEIVTVGLLLGQKVQEAHAHARTLRAAIDAATTAAEVEAVAWVLV